MISWVEVIPLKKLFLELEDEEEVLVGEEGVFMGEGEAIFSSGGAGGFTEDDGGEGVFV